MAKTKNGIKQRLHDGNQSSKFKCATDHEMLRKYSKFLQKVDSKSSPAGIYILI